MGEVNNNEEKQNLKNIKAIFELDKSSSIPKLYSDVKKARQQLANFSNALKDKYVGIKQKREDEEKKIEILKAKEASVAAMEKKLAEIEGKQKPEVSTEKVVEKTVAKPEPVAEKVEVAPVVETKPVEVEKTVAEPVAKPEVAEKKVFEQRSESGEQNRGFRQEFDRNHNNFNNQNNSSHQFNNRNNQNNNNPNYRNYNNGQNRPNGHVGYQNRNNGQQFDNRNRQFNNGNNIQYAQRNESVKPYTPRYNQNGSNPNGFQRYNNQQGSSFGNRPFGPRPFGQNRPQQQNRGIASIIPKKTTGLESASSVFGNKDQRVFTNKKKSVEHTNTFEDKKINKKSLLRRGLIEEHNIEERMVTRKLKLKKPKVEQQVVVSAPVTHAVITTPNLTIKILSEKIGKPVTEIIKQCMILGNMCTINSSIDFPTAELVASELGVTLELKLDKTFEEKLKENIADDDESMLEKRPPIITVMGHVDHGKTSLLDYIRKTRVTSGEAGGITQSIGAYSIVWNKEKITFVDTPGHQAFANMRKRGAEITDVAVLVVAGDDGIKPQTVEAIKFIKEAKVPMIVAVNKMDKLEFNIDRVKQQLTEYDILPEEWGGDTVVVPISAATGQGIDKLLEMIVLVSEMQNLKANKKRGAVGTVIEARLDKSMGPVANIIVQNGTLKIGDPIVSGFAFGKVRAMIDDKGKNIRVAEPSTPVSVLGFDNVPQAGDLVQAVDEKLSKSVIEERKTRMAQEKIDKGLAKSLDEFLATPEGTEKKVLNVIIKADVQGSVEALKESLETIENEEVALEVVSAGAGEITENDVQLAKVSNAIIIGFNIKSNSKSISFAKRNKIDIKSYNIIYEAIEEMEKEMKKLMAPKFQERVIGHAEVRALFKISSVGTIAGCMVTDGKVQRNAEVRVIRKDEVICTSKISTLKRGKDDAKEVASGFECGIKIDNFNDIAEGDIIECAIQEQINI